MSLRPDDPLAAPRARRHHPRMRPAAALVLAAAAALALAACGGGGGAPQAPQADRVELRVANLGEVGVLDAFAREVERRTGGRVRVVDAGVARVGDDPAGEVGVFGDVKDGTYDLAILPTRSIEAAGGTSFAAFNAPGVLVTDAQQRAVLASEAPALAAAALERETGVHALAILPGELRHPVGVVDPLVGLADYAGARVRFYPGSPTYARTAEALGATQVVLGDRDLAIAVRDRTVRGLEADVTSGLVNDPGPMTVNVVLFSKLWAIVAAPRALDGLSEADRAALGSAARATATAAFDLIPDEGAKLASRCRAGDRVVVADAAALGELAAAVAPVVAEVAADPEAGPVLAALRAAAGEASAATPIGEDECDALAPATPAATVDAAPAIPDGTYRLKVSPDEVATRFPGFTADDVACTAGVFTLELRGGRFHYVQRFVASCSTATTEGDVVDGSYTTSGDRLELVSTTLNGFTQQPMTANCRWKAVDGGLETVMDDPWDGTAGVNAMCAILGPDPLPTFRWQRVGD